MNKKISLKRVSLGLVIGQVRNLGLGMIPFYKVEVLGGVV